MKSKTDNSSQDQKIDISVVIVNYRSWVHLRDCLSHLIDIPQDDFTFEVIIVDNFSNDNKIRKFSSEFSKFKFIENPINGGFSNGCNMGAHYAKGDYLLFLNPDAIASKHTFLNLLQTAKSDFNIGVVSCTKITKKGSFETEARLFPTLPRLFGLFRAINKLLNKNKLVKRFDSSKELIFPDWVSGSVFFMSRPWFDNMGGWNEDYWLYFEDVDFCKRISDAGGKIALTRATKVVHSHGGASRLNIRTSALTKVEVIISKHVYFHNHFSGLEKFMAQTLYVIVTTVNKFLFAIIGLVFFFIPKLKLQLLMFINLMRYYLNALTKSTWISKRAINYRTSTSLNNLIQKPNRISNLQNEMIKLSAVIITYNEEEHLEKCLSSLIDVADEIIVVDSFSTDRTPEICKQFKVKFIQQEFLGYIEQKNFAVTQASHDHILSLDGDEALSDTLKTSILQAKSNWVFDGYYCNRLNNYCGQWIKYSDWYPDKKLRLFKKGSGEWKGINPHDTYTLKHGYRAGKLKGDLLHWIFRDYTEHNLKVEQFSTISANAYFELGIKSSLWKIVYRPLWAFFKAYFLRLGFLDGLNGLIICVQAYNMTFLKYIKLRELYKKGSKDN